MSFPLPGTSYRHWRWSTCLQVTLPSSLVNLHESGPVLLSMCAFFHWTLEPCPLYKLSPFLCVVMRHLLCQLLGFNVLSDFRSNAIKSRSQAAVEQQLCWCNSSCCLGCWSIRLQESAESGVHCAPGSFQFLHSVFNWTEVSTRPLDDGCLGVVFTCKIPFLIMTLCNSSLAKPVPLSETTLSGNPWVAKTCRNFSIVAVALVIDVGYTSIHSLYVFITIRK